MQGCNFTKQCLPILYFAHLHGDWGGGGGGGDGVN